MIIVGARGHALEVFDQLDDKLEVFFFDNVNKQSPVAIHDKLILKDLDSLENIVDKRFVLGLGGTYNRRKIYEEFLKLNFSPYTLIASSANVSVYSTLSKGLNIMALSFIGPQTSIGIGTLINSLVSVHHNCCIGDFVEIAPGATVLGNVTIKDNVFIGSNATILPHVIIEEGAVVGAGAVVNKNVASFTTVVGVPALVK